MRPSSPAPFFNLSSLSILLLGAILLANQVVTLPSLSSVLLAVGLTVFVLAQLETVQPTSENLAEDVLKPMAWPLRMVGSFFDLLPGTAWDISDADSLLRQGAREAGLSMDGYSPLVVEAIHKFCNSLISDDVKLTWVGRKNLHWVITSGLSQYLLVQQHAKENPELMKTKLKRPLIVVGLPRSGTTHLHRLLSAVTTDAKFLSFSDHFLPLIPPFLMNAGKVLGVDLRRFFIHSQFYGWKFVANQYGMDSVHFVRPDLADECTFSLRLAGSSFLLYHLLPTFEYCDWLLDHDASGSNVRHSYETYRLVLQMIQHQNPEHRFVLKCPSHTFNIAILREVIPEAVVVATHRDPCKTSASICSLTARLQAASCAGIDWRRSVHMSIKKDIKSSEAIADFCRKHPDDQSIHHVSYKDLVANPARVVRDIQTALDIPMVNDFEARIEQYMTRNAQHSRGVHHYSFKGMGLNAENISQQFDAYKTFFAEYL